MSRRIVVDASIARSAGTTENPVSIRCREFLQTMLHVCHRIVMTTDLMREWQKHRSTFALGWLATMQRRGKVITVLPDSENHTLLALAIHKADLPKKQRDALAKDCLLVVAAWEADRLIASRDNKVRNLFASLNSHVDGIGSLIWVNPDHSKEDVTAWLHAGARSENHRRLDQYQYPE
jgi:hypothetical protein